MILYNDLFLIFAILNKFASKDICQETGQLRMNSGKTVVLQSQLIIFFCNPFDLIRIVQEVLNFFDGLVGYKVVNLNHFKTFWSNICSIDGVVIHKYGLSEQIVSRKALPKPSMRDG